MLIKIDLLVLIREDRHNYQQICRWRSCICKHSIHKGWHLLLAEDTNFFVQNQSCICPVRNNLTGVRCIIFFFGKNRKRFIQKLEHLTSVRKCICRLLDKFSENNEFRCVTGETILCCRGSSLLSRFPGLVFHNASTLQMKMNFDNINY